MDIVHIIDNIKDNKITKLSLTDKKYSVDHVIEIVKLLEFNNSVLKLDLSKNYFENTKMMEIIKLLQKNNSIQIFIANANDMYANCAVAIFEWARMNTNLQEIYLDENFICSFGTHAIYELLRSTINLQELHIDQNTISKLLEQQRIDEIYYMCGLVVCESHNSYNSHYMIRVAIDGEQGEPDDFCHLCRHIMRFNDMRNNILQKIENIWEHAEDLPHIVSVCEKIIHKFLEQQHFDFNNIYSVDATTIAELLKSCSNLKVLSLACNNMGNGAAVRIIKSLLSNNCLEDLNMAMNYINYGAGNIISKVLSSNINLKHLNLSRNNLGDSGIIAIVSTRPLQSLVSLNLSTNHITTNGVSIIANLLSSNKLHTLQELDLSNNNLSNDAIITIAKSLESNSHLLCLELNQIRDIDTLSFSTFGKMLEINNCLRRLSLGMNSIDSNCAINIFNSLKKNNCLQELLLPCNNITADGISNLNDVLQHNTTLKHLNIGSNKIGTVGAQYIATILNNNATLTTLNVCFTSLNINDIVDIIKSTWLNTHITTLYFFHKCCKTNENLIINALNENYRITSIGNVLHSNKIKEILKRNKRLHYNLRLVKTKVATHNNF